MDVLELIHLLQDTKEYVTEEKQQRSFKTHLPINTPIGVSRSIWVLHKHTQGHSVQPEKQVHCEEWLTEDKELCSACFPSLTPLPLLSEEQTLWTPVIWRILHGYITLQQNDDSTQIETPHNFEVCAFSSTGDICSIAYSRCHSAATFQEVFVTQIWSLLVLFWSFSYKLMLGSPKSPWDLHFQDEIIVWASQREQKPFIPGEITHDWKSRCTLSYPLILKARAKYLSHLIHHHVTTRDTVPSNIFPTRKGLWAIESGKWESN